MPPKKKATKDITIGLMTGSEDESAARAPDNIEESSTNSAVGSEDILKAILDMKAEFSGKLEKVLSVMDNISREVKECAGRVSQAELRISEAEGNIGTLNVTTSALEEKVIRLTSKLVDLEGRSRRSNLRLVHLPEGAEGKDACSFLEQWIPEALDMGTLRFPLIIERAHRISGPRSNPDAPPRALIMKFLNYKDKERVANAARAKGRVLYKNQHVMFFPDLPMEVHKQQKRFDDVKQRLRAKAIRYGIIYPARMRITHNDRSYIFETPTEVEDFLETLSNGVAEQR